LRLRKGGTGSGQSALGQRGRLARARGLCLGPVHPRTAIGRKALRIKGLAPYTPDFTTAFDHFCIHTGGRGVIDEMEKQLRLPSAAVAPSRDTLRRCVLVFCLFSFFSLSLFLFLLSLHPLSTHFFSLLKQPQNPLE
jgi:hypothetical protein